MKRLMAVGLFLFAAEASAQGYTRAWLPDPTCNGVVVRTAANTTTCRTITAGTGISMSNGDGVSGNPTPSVDTATTPQYTSGTGSPPATCNVGEVYAETDQLRACTCSATNTWTCNGKLRNHATDCTSLTDGLVNELCFEADANTLYVCEPSAGGCDTAGEWTSVAGGSGAPTDAKYIVAELNAGLSAEIAPASDDQTPVSDSSTGVTWRTLPNCTDTGGNHLNYTQSSNSFSCGTTGGALDINGLTAEPLLNPFDDYIPFYDGSAAANRKSSFDSRSQVGRSFWRLEDDFLGPGESIATAATASAWWAEASGTGATFTQISSEAGHQGIKRFTTGTSTTGNVGMLTQGAHVDAWPILLGDGRVSFTTWVRLSALSDGTDTYTLKVGINTCGAGSVVCGTIFDAAQFTYTHSVNSGKWRAECIEDLTTTNVDDTGSAVAASTWYRLSFLANAAATSIEFFVNGSSIGSCATNVPDTGDPMGPNLQIVKSAGTTSRNVDLDAISIFGEITTTR